MATPVGRRVSYFVDPGVADVRFSPGHAMRPVRLRLLHSLVASLGLEPFLDVAEARPASPAELLAFHPPEFIRVLQSADALGRAAAAADGCAAALLAGYGVEPGPGHHGGDCPVFPRLWDVVSSYCGASLAAARAVRHGVADVAINWSGGMHHAHAARCSGFCYANDVALAILELLRSFQRVLYVDLDVHHGDGVEDAFRHNPRVLTLSIHQFGEDFFPRTGGFDSSVFNSASAEEGAGNGAASRPFSFSSSHSCCPSKPSLSSAAALAGGASSAFAAHAAPFAINIPLPAGTGDGVYTSLFLHALSQAVRAFDPEAIVVQCGADTIHGDVLGGLCVSTHAHATCVEAVLGLELPTVMLGGGGYNVLHTARCWAVHTAVALGRHATLPALLPASDANYTHFVRGQRGAEAFAPPRLHVVPPDGAALPRRRQQLLVGRVMAVLEAQLRPVRALRCAFVRQMAAVEALSNGAPDGGDGDTRLRCAPEDARWVAQIGALLRRPLIDAEARHQ